MRHILSAVVLVGTLAAATSGAQALTTVLARTSTKITDDGRVVHVINNNDVMICKYVPIVGSRLTSAVCHTALEWKHMHDYSREYLEDINRGAGMGGKVF